MVLPLQMAACFEHQNIFIANQSPHLFFNLSSKGEAARQVFPPSPDYLVEEAAREGVMRETSHLLKRRWEQREASR